MNRDVKDALIGFGIIWIAAFLIVGIGGWLL